MNTTPILESKSLTKKYDMPNGESVSIIRGINFSVEDGQTVAITGHSGSGKTTFLSLLAGMDNPTDGAVHVAGQDITAMDERKLTEFRARNIGFVFQRFFLLPHLTAIENVSLPLDILGDLSAKDKANEALNLVGLSHRTRHFPDKLSGGECQRVAIARSLVTKPRLILADEPTGNLDQETGDKITDLFFGLVRDLKQTLVVVTHNVELAKRCDRHLNLREGNLI